MSKPERVFAALRGEEVDRVPVSAWWHDFAREWSPQGLADATLEAYRRYDWDFIKVNPRACYYAEDWGARYQQSDQPHQQPELLQPGVASPQDLRRVRPLDVSRGAYGEQLLALSIIARELAGEAPFIQAVFSPLAAMSRLAGSTKYVQKLMREAPQDLEAALEAIADTLRSYAAACLQEGASGIFFATVEWGGGDNISPEDYDRFARPFDLRVLEAVRDADFNVLHVCRESNHLARLLDYPVHVFHWASRSPGNPSLSDVRAKTGRALMGGVDHQHTIANGSPADVVAEAQDALERMGGRRSDGHASRRFLLAPECSIDPQTPEENLRALAKVVRP
jgi:uroporphyrinogen decarboxylase